MALAAPDRDRVTRAFLACGEVALALATRDEVRRAWDTASSCAGMSVGGLAHHLLGQTRNAARLLGAPSPTQSPVIGLLEHYARAPWVSASHRGEIDPEQLETDNAGARSGPRVVLAEARAALESLPTLLADPRDPDTVHIPWQGWSLSTPDFLLTRMMETVVHADDLAVSIGVEPPSFDEEAVDAVVGLLSAIAVRRHGPTALVRALSRPQRAEGDISAF